MWGAGRAEMDERGTQGIGGRGAGCVWGEQKCMTTRGHKRAAECAHQAEEGTLLGAGLAQREVKCPTGQRAGAGGRKQLFG